MNLERTLVLVGPTGAGKSSVGGLLAAQRGAPFFDLDAEIERHAGRRISAIFERDGEATFRALEREVLADLLDHGPCVLATGGGAVLDGLNRQRMRERAFVVHLHAGVGTQLRRLEGDRTRPLLAGPDRAAALHAMAAQRTPLYREVADLTVDTDGLDAHAVAACIGEALDERRPLQDLHA
jgi:shikimate kinase